MHEYKIMEDMKYPLLGSIEGYKLELKLIYRVYNKTKDILKKEKNIGLNANIIKQLEYRMISSNIINIISAWEQQLYLFIYDIFDKSITNKYDLIRDECYINKLGIDKNLFDQLSVYRKLNNALKHGTGKSYEELKKKNTKYTDYPSKFIELIDCPAFNIPVLNLEETDVENIGQIFYNFWNSIIIEIEKRLSK